MVRGTPEQQVYTRAARENRRDGTPLHHASRMFVLKEETKEVTQMVSH